MQYNYQQGTGGPYPGGQSRPRQAGPGRGGAAPQSQRTAPQGGRSPRRAKAPNTRSRWFQAIVMVIATLVFCVFLSTFILASAQDVFGLNQESQDIQVMIPENATIRDVSNLLAERGVVNQALTFYLYASIKAEDGDFLAGDYPLNSDMGYDEIIRDLKNGNFVRNEKDVLFIEGRTVYEVASILEDEEIVSAEEFLEYLQTGDLDYEFMKDLPRNPYRFRRLEGYVFPETLRFYVDDDVENVAYKFLSEFESRITDEMWQRMEELGMTLDETIILASIIQKEAGDPFEMRKVSSVFHNRLNNPEAYPRLESDVTIHYVENFIKPFLEDADQDMYDAYNTYVCEGLPAGPICNPGESAILAALNPEDTDYYFFVTDDQGNYYYAATAEKHYENIALAEEDGGDDIHGTGTVQD